MAEPRTFTVSGDADAYYVSDETGHIVATCTTSDDANTIAEALNPPDRRFYPFGKLDPDDPIDQAIVNAFNKPPEPRRADG